METFGQSYGYILYRTKVSSAAEGELVLPQMRSYARIYVNQKFIGDVDRRKKQDWLKLSAKKGDTLDILVEGTGRINFTTELRNERQGLNGAVTLAGRGLTGWEVFPLPMNDLANLHFSAMPTDLSGPVFYSGHFDLQTLGDTFLDTRGLGKGAVWINGHAIGRFWNVGPQQTLYVPAPWLKQGRNEIVVFTLGGHELRMRGLREPVLNELGSE
jgi:beta-galactosidase